MVRNIIKLATGRPPIKMGDYHNMPARYSKRFTEFIVGKTPRRPQYEQKVYRYKTTAYYDQWRPWESEFQNLNEDGVSIRKVFVEPHRHWSFFRGDRVEVMVGPDAGKQGIVNYYVKERNWVFVEGLNLERKLEFGRLMTSREQPLLADREVKLVDPSDLMPTDFEWLYDDKGERVRISKRTQRILPIPKQAYETIDYKTKDSYKETPKDTVAAEANKKTFEPKAKTFEMDICDSMGIKDNRIPHPTYWY